jgi:hypothetical protein
MASNSTGVNATTDTANSTDPKMAFLRNNFKPKGPLKFEEAINYVKQYFDV